MSTLAGIDLGTTYSALAVLNNIGKPEIVPDFEGNRLTPSVVMFSKETEAVYVGQEAKNQISDAPDDAVQFVKRHMGEPDMRFPQSTKKYSPIEISSFILKKLKTSCTQNGEIHDVVITVPAHFNEVERKSTMDAGKIAGLNVLGIINEPTAAALYYSSLSPISGNVLVFDLGGGTFDVTIVNIDGKNINIKTSKGDSHLGGMDFDHELVKIVNRAAKKQNGAPLFPDSFLASRDDAELDPDARHDYWTLMKIVEATKRQLSRRDSAKVNFTSSEGDSIRVEISRSEFEEAISTYIATTEMLVENALEDAKMSKKDISKVLLVGGSTRVPAVLNSIKSYFGFPPEQAVNVDEAVALGAAISASLKKIQGGGDVSASVRREASKISLSEVCNKNFGTLAISFNEARGVEELQNTTILHKNTKVPCENTENFYTRVPNQERVKVRVTESEEETRDKDEVTIVGEFDIPLPPNTPKGSELSIKYSYDENQRLGCEVTGPDGEVYTTELSYNTQGTMTVAEVRKKQAQMNDFIVE